MMINVMIYGLLIVLAISIITTLFLLLKRKGSRRVNFNKFACHNNGASMDKENVRAIMYSRIGLQ